DGRGGRSAALRWREGERDERQGGFGPQPPPLGLAACDQGDLRPADRLQVPVPGGGLRCIGDILRVRVPAWHQTRRGDSIHLPVAQRYGTPLERRLAERAETPQERSSEAAPRAGASR